MIIGAATKVMLVRARIPVRINHTHNNMMPNDLLVMIYLLPGLKNLGIRGYLTYDMRIAHLMIACITIWKIT